MPRRDERKLDLNLLFTLDALLRHGSVTRAAQQLDVTQSAVSHSLRRLRSFYGDPLFVKGGGGVVPTDRAMALSALVTQVIESATQTLQSGASFDPEVSRRNVTVCTSDMGEMSILPDLLRLVLQAAPGINLRTINLQTPELERALLTGDVDLVISGPLKLPQGYLNQSLFTHRWTVVASDRAPRRAQLTLADYAAARHVAVIPARVDLGVRSMVWQKLNVAPRAVLTTSHVTSVPWLLEQNPGLIATVPRLLAIRHVHSNGLREIATDFTLPSLPIKQYWHRRLGSDAFGVWFRAQVRQAVRALRERKEL